MSDLSPEAQKIMDSVLNMEYRVGRIQEELAATKRSLHACGTVSSTRLEALDSVLLRLEAERKKLRNE